MILGTTSPQHSTKSQVFTIKGDQLSELSRLVKRVGDQQKELILDISKQLGKHNEMMNTAMDKQQRMEAKIDNIEAQLRQKAAIGYQKKMERIEQLKQQQEAAKKKQLEQKSTKKAQGGSGRKKTFSEDFEEEKTAPLGSLTVSQQHQISRQRKASRSSSGQHGSDDDGFKSCDSNEEDLKKKAESQKTKQMIKSSLAATSGKPEDGTQSPLLADGEQSAQEIDGGASTRDESKESPIIEERRERPKTGDAYQDFYAEMDDIPVGTDELKYIKLGKGAVDHLIKELDPEIWTKPTVSKGCEIMYKKAGCELSCYRVDTQFNFPPELVVEYMCRNPEKRLKWDEGLEFIRPVFEYRMNTQLVYAKVKAQWPLGARDLFLIFQGYQDSTGSLYLGSYSVDHPEYPPDPTGKMVRVQTVSGHYLFEALDGGKRTYVRYITEFNFGKSVPKKMVQGVACDTFCKGMVKMKQIMAKEHPDKMTQ